VIETLHSQPTTLEHVHRLAPGIERKTESLELMYAGWGFAAAKRPAPLAVAAELRPQGFARDEI
jgi:hypothetical protein